MVLKKNHLNIELLLIKRKNEPFKDFWALPGGFVNENEDLEVAAIRELFEETRIKITKLEQLKAFGKPLRDPRNHVVSIAFLGFVKNNIDSHHMTSGSFVFIENNKQKFVSIIRKNDIWIFDETSYALAFYKAEATFMILCCWAHGFWILFLSFLILFHFRRANKI